MLLTKSFAITDHEGVNALLTQFRLAPGAHVFVSEGNILVPYEDGAPPNKAQQIITILEERNKVAEEMRIIVHSNKVVDHLVADAQDRVNVLRAKYDAATANPVKKEIEKDLKNAETALADIQNQKRMNDHEISRLQVNIDLFEAEVERIKAA